MGGAGKILVVGGGLAGQLTALSLARSGRQVALIAPTKLHSVPGDPYGTARTTAFLSGSVKFLQSLGLWDAVADYAAPLETMQLIDPQGQGSAAFRGSDCADAIDGAFGLNVPNRVVSNALCDAIAAAPAIECVEGQVTGLDRADRIAQLRLAGAEPAAGQLIVACDGARSTIRSLCRIGVQHSDYQQFALTLVVRHQLPHNHVSTEFHYPNGPLTLVPLPGNRSSIVYVCDAAGGRARLKWSPERLVSDLADRAQGQLGAAADIEILAGPGGFPIHGVMAERLIDPRVALVGEAAHALPPIGAQGLNSTLLDIAWLTDSLRGASDPGSAAPLRAYSSRRQADIALRFKAIHGLNKAVLSTSDRVAELRGAITGAVGANALAQQALMAFGMIGPNRFPEFAS